MFYPAGAKNISCLREVTPELRDAHLLGNFAGEDIQRGARLTSKVLNIRCLPDEQGELPIDSRPARATGTAFTGIGRESPEKSEAATEDYGFTVRKYKQ